MADGNRREIEMNYSRHWHFLRPTARGILEREVTPGRSLPDVPFVATRVDRVARVIYELSQAFEVPAKPQAQDDSTETFLDTFLPYGRGARPCPALTIVGLGSCGRNWPSSRTQHALMMRSGVTLICMKNL